MEYEGDTIFSKIIRREIPAQIVFENDTVMAFRDVRPQAPHHLLVIPKKKLEGMNAAGPDDREILGEMLLTARKIAHDEGFAEDGYRLVINTGEKGGQTVFHLHLHVLGGRSLDWPPG